MSAMNREKFSLKESNGTVTRVNEGPLSGFSIFLDGIFIKSYLNGVFEARNTELINNTTGFQGYPNGLFQNKNPYYFLDGIGNNGSDFTTYPFLIT